MLWGALTARLTRDLGSSDYVGVGRAVNNHLAFSYGYLCVQLDGSQTLLPRYTTAGFQFTVNGQLLTERQAQRLCVISYASTALNYRSNAAEEGSLHEVEFISPRALCAQSGMCVGAPLSLTAYIAASEMAATTPEVQGWEAALTKLQVGGERTYGFGQLSLVSGISGSAPTVNDLWGNQVQLGGTRPEVVIDADGSLLAHVDVSQLGSSDVEHGSVEPLLGRDTTGVNGRRPPPSSSVEPLLGRDTTPQSAFGKDIRTIGVCWQPGARLRLIQSFRIGEYGLWERVSV
jgi:hypothetical protein